MRRPTRRWPPWPWAWPWPPRPPPPRRPRPPGPPTTPTSARLYQSELERTLARHRAPGVIAAQPVANTDPAVPNPGVDVPATLLVGLAGGLLGGAGVMVGWTATTRRRRPPAAAGT